MDFFLIAIIVVFIGLQISVSVFASRFIKNEDDFILAGRQIGPFFLSMSLFATWFGSETIIASSSAVASEGLSGARAEPFGYALCLVIMALFIACKLREKLYSTLSDFFKDRFGVTCEKISAILIVPTSLIWAAAQALAFAHILTSISGMDITGSLLLATMLCLVYTMIGGFLGDIYTDLIQGVIIIYGLLITAGFVIFYLGGIDMALAKITPEKLNLINPNIDTFSQIDSWVIAVVGSLTAQEALQRALAAQSPNVARQSFYCAAALYFTIGLIPLFLGLVGGDLVDVNQVGEAFLPELAKEVLPPIIYILFLGALCSAILSTIDSTLLSISAVVGHNLVVPLNPEMREDSKILVQRIIVAISGIAVFYIASSGENIYSLIELSSSFGSAGMVVCLLLGLWTKWGGPLTGLITIITGALSAWFFQYEFEWAAGYTASLVLCLIVYILMSYFEKTFLTRLPQVPHAS
jgi:SSS family transporter